MNGLSQGPCRVAKKADSDVTFNRTSLIWTSTKDMQKCTDMPGVQRSQSLRTDYSPVTLRPKVSFNKAVHIKRISKKERLPQVPEDEDSPIYSEKIPMAANGVKGSSKFSTLPSRGARNGVKKLTEAPAASERLSRMIRHDAKPEEPPKVERSKKKSLGERMKGIFGKKKTEEDELKSRYTEFKGRNSSSDATDNEAENYSGKRRGSAPETRNSWFRSLERLKKNELPPTTRDIHRKERYFGESDRESSRRRHNESSAESATEVDGMGPRTPSLVYLHTAAVGDIPHRRSDTPTKRLSRSVSVLAPWAPRMRPPRATRSRATQTDFSQSQEEKRPSSKTRVIEVEREPSSIRQTSRSLPKLVFTGPSIDDTVGRSATSTIQRSTVHLRSRK